MATSAWSQVRPCARCGNFGDSEDLIGLAIGRDIVEGYGGALRRTWPVRVGGCLAERHFQHVPRRSPRRFKAKPGACTATQSNASQKPALEHCSGAAQAIHDEHSDDDKWMVLDGGPGACCNHAHAESDGVRPIAGAPFSCARSFIFVRRIFFSCA